MVDTLHPSFEVIGSWPTPNYVNPSTQGPGLFYCAIVFGLVGAVVVGARVWSRVFLTRAPGSDDLFIVAGLLLSIALSVMLCIQNVTDLMGRHVWDVPPSKFAALRLNVYICEWLYLAASGCVKVSILLFYRRLSVSFSRNFRIATWLGIAYVVIVWAGLYLGLLLQCRPIKSFWMELDFGWAATHDYKCGGENISLPLSGALSVVGDAYSTILPLLMVHSITRSWQEKIGMYALFGLGFLSVAAGIIRTVLLHRLISVDYDVPWVLWDMWVWTLVELYVAIFAASAPALKPFFRRFIATPLSKMSSQHDRSQRSQLGSKVSKVSKHFSTGNRSWTMVSSNRASWPTDPEKNTTTSDYKEPRKSYYVNDDSSDQFEMNPTSRSEMIIVEEEEIASLHEVGIAR